MFRGRRFASRAGAVGCTLLGLLAAGCASRVVTRPADPALIDRYLMERGRAAVAQKRWTEARVFFRELIENHPGSPLRPEAKLAVGEALLAERSRESLLLAVNEFREFLAVYPADPRADRAQYSLALTFFHQMRKPDRDQTPTRQALAEFDVFFSRYPKSPFEGWARRDWRIARDTLSASAFGVGRTYFKMRYYPGAISRFTEVIADDPGYSAIDAVYFYLADALARSGRRAEAVPLFDRVVKQYRTSEYARKAEEKLRQLTESDGRGGIRPRLSS